MLTISEQRAFRLPGTPRSRQWRVEGYSAATQEEHADQSAGAVEAEGSSGDHPQLVVEAFGKAVGEPGFDIGEDAVHSQILAPDSCLLLIRSLHCIKCAGIEIIPRKWMIGRVYTSI
jgi:predicted HD phosphohydrolase